MRNGSGSFLPLGLGYITSAVEAKGFTVKVLNCADSFNSFYPEDLDKFELCLRFELPKHSPMLVGIGPCITSQLKALKIISYACKNTFPDVAIICGGPLATMRGQEWVFFEFLGIKHIIKGDAEEAIPNLLITLKNKQPIINCNQVSYAKHLVVNEIANIDNLHFPHRYVEENAKISLRRKDKTKSQKTLPIITSRGCIYSCDYCVSGSLSKKKFHKRSCQNIIDEMRTLRDEYSTTDIIFYDDCFFHDLQTVNDDIISFCSLLLEQNINMNWQIELRSDLVLSIDESSIDLLEKAGCRQINIGIEKTTDKMLRSIGKNSSVIGLREKNYLIVSRSNILLTGTFILGGPGEDETSTKQLVRDAKELSLTAAHFSPLFLYPSTKLYDTNLYKSISS
jgi:radical SAM superfamily enzyme YgiQ (UPF0313 family)